MDAFSYTSLFTGPTVRFKQLAIVIKVVRNYDNLEGIFQFWENDTLEH